MKWIVILLMCISFIGYSQNTEKEENTICPTVCLSHHQNLVIGLGFQYSSNVGDKVPFFRTRNGEPIALKTKYGFNGVTLNYSHGIEGKHYQNIDLSFQ